MWSRAPYVWNFTCHTLIAASAPVPANLPSELPSDTQSTALTPPGIAFLIAMFFMGFLTLHTYMWVSNAPEAQWSESAVQLSVFTRAEWKDQREVISSRFGTSYRTTFPLDCEKRKEKKKDNKVRQPTR